MTNENSKNSTDEELDSSWKILEKPEISWTSLAEAESKPKAEIPIKPISEIKKPIEEMGIQTKKPKKIWQILKFVGAITGVFIFIYAFLTFPALFSKATYWWGKNIAKTKPQTQTIIPQTVNNEILFLSTVTNYAPPDKPQENKLPTKESLGAADLGNNELWIPKLEKKSPIFWDSPVDEATMQQNLKYGVVHYQGTVKPDERTENGAGNIFISGHSSYYWWDEGKYKTIFANLDQMEVGDEVAIGYNDKAYIYKVVEKFEVSPDEVWVLDQNTQKPTLSLMTCVPVGTNLRRLIVKAELVAVGSNNGEIIDTTNTPQPSPPPTITTTSQAVPQPTPTKLPDLDPLNLLPWRW